MATRQRFELALDQLSAETWALFEQLCSSFLASEFPSLRTMSVPEGDGGRDAILWSPDGAGVVALQYSVADKWDAKVADTARRLSTYAPGTKILIYVSNRLIGARGDELRARIQRDYGLFLDIRDRSWFLDRQDRSIQQQKAADELARSLVDPLLASRDIIAAKGQALNTLESRAALVYLGLQWEDDTRDKGLTKLSFEALVRSTLRDTDPDHRLHRGSIRDAVRHILSTHDTKVIDQQTDGALRRMAKRSVRHYQQTDEFCLTHDERLRLRERLVERERRDIALQKEIVSLVNSFLPDLSTIGVADSVQRTRRVVERYLLSRGEEFASNVATGRAPSLSAFELRDIVIKDFAEYPIKNGALHPDHSVAIAIELLDSSSPSVQTYLRSIADSYTLLAFLRETPDIQSAVAKMFAYGEVWLDTSVVLPLFAEELAEGLTGRFTAMVRAAIAAGMELRITRGVLEELERHMNRSAACAATHAASWEGKLPFLYSMYVLSGRPQDRFTGWLETFRGGSRPQDDIAEYLDERYSIKLGTLEAETAASPTELRFAVQEIFAAAHEQRRRGTSFLPELDPITTNRLVQHDVENYVGVIWKRRSEDVASLGHKTWWLTLDREAYRVRSLLETRMSGRVPDSPAMSPDFLVNYLALGPVRASVPRDLEGMLPLITESIGEFMPPELVSTAETIRAEASDLPEHLIRRRVRDGLDAAKRRIGLLSRGGAALMEQTVADAIKPTSKSNSSAS